jgi:hypothetical protein
MCIQLTRCRWVGTRRAITALIARNSSTLECYQLCLSVWVAPAYCAYQHSATSATISFYERPNDHMISTIWDCHTSRPKLTNDTCDLEILNDQTILPKLSCRCPNSRDRNHPPRLALSQQIFTEIYYGRPGTRSAIPASAVFSN